MNLLNACRQTARRTFGIERLRPDQESAMLAVLNGRDALVALPAGSGKSLIYQVPAMILKRPTIVVSPALALTATATPRVRTDIVARLRLRGPLVLVAPAHRENLRLTVDIVSGAEKFRAAARHIRALRRPGIIYCATTTSVDEVGGALKRAGIPVVRYHGKMGTADRAVAQRLFIRPSRRLIMVATSAFGMGIDKPNIRYILHYQAPGSLEQYVQEVGRAGRDGHPARCILLFDAADMEIQRRLQALSRPGVWHLERLENALTA